MGYTAGTVPENVAPNCYEPITRSRDISITRNSISYSTLANTNSGSLGLGNSQGRKDTNVGVYVEYSDNVLYANPGSMVGVESNRMINSTFNGSAPVGTAPGETFCLTPSSNLSVGCPRRLDSSSSLMSRTCGPVLEKSCVFQIPGVPANQNEQKLREYYAGICSPNNRNPTDEEMMFP